MPDSERTDIDRAEELLVDLLHGEIDEERRDTVIAEIRRTPGLDEEMQAKEAFLERVRQALPAALADVSEDRHEAVMRAVSDAHIDRLQEEAEGTPEREVPDSVHSNIMEVARKGAHEGDEKGGDVVRLERDDDSADGSGSGSNSGSKGRGSLMLFAAAAAILLAAGLLAWAQATSDEPETRDGRFAASAPGGDEDDESPSRAFDQGEKFDQAVTDNAKPTTKEPPATGEQAPPNSTGSQEAAVARRPSSQNGPTGEGEQPREDPLEGAKRLEGFDSAPGDEHFEHARQEGGAPQLDSRPVEGPDSQRLATNIERLKRLYEAGDYIHAARSAQLMLERGNWSDLQRFDIMRTQLRALEKMRQEEEAGEVRRKLEQNYPERSVD